jgi:hypothetical protein
VRCGRWRSVMASARPAIRVSCWSPDRASVPAQRQRAVTIAKWALLLGLGLTTAATAAAVVSSDRRSGRTR